MTDQLKRIEQQLDKKEDMELSTSAINCAAIGCKQIVNQYALVALIPNLKEGIPFCYKCYEELFTICDVIINLCKDIRDKVLCPFSEDWYEGIISDIQEETKGPVTLSHGCVVDLLTSLGWSFETLISKLDKDFAGMEHVVKALYKVHDDWAKADCF